MTTTTTPAQWQKCATCRYFDSIKTLRAFGRVVETDLTAICRLTFHGKKKVSVLQFCNNYKRDPNI